MNVIEMVGVIWKRVWIEEKDNRERREGMDGYDMKKEKREGGRRVRVY